MILQCLNSLNPHSIKKVKLLAIFSGKDNKENTEAILGPVIKELEELHESTIPELSNLSSNNTGKQSMAIPLEASLCTSSDLAKEKQCELPSEHISCNSYCLCNKGSHPRIFSELCEQCLEEKKENSSLSGSQLVDPHKNCRCGLSKCKVSYGGDFMFMAISILGLTGPNGPYFCPFWLGKIHDLTDGSLEAFTARTIPGIQQQHEEYSRKGAVKSKVSLFQNSGNQPLIARKSPFIDRVSCMPVHISVGLGKATLDEIN